MNINRHNYEEFFLLYVDNELSAADRKTVDVFVQENPDLQLELLSLQQTISKADDIVLDKKDWLHMEEGIPALQENLLLYADEELSLSDKKTVEALLATDRSALAEWNTLRQTKLEPDTAIIFADKRSLYRTEGRVVGFKWWRAAAAAVLLGFGLWTGISVYKNKSNTRAGEETIAKENRSKSGQSIKEIPGNTNAAKVQPANTPTQQNQNTTIAAAPVNTKEQEQIKTDQSAEKIVKKNIPEQKDNIAVQNNGKKPSNNLPKPYFENINRKESNEIASANVIPEKSNNVSGSGINDVVVKTNPKEKLSNPVVAGLNKDNTDPTTTAAIPVVYTEENNDRFLYMNEEKVKRTKLGGLFRQAKRVLERTANIKTGDGLKVAGFEIAIK